MQSICVSAPCHLGKSSAGTLHLLTSDLQCGSLRRAVCACVVSPPRRGFSSWVWPRRPVALRFVWPRHRLAFLVRSGKAPPSRLADPCVTPSPCAGLFFCVVRPRRPFFATPLGMTASSRLVAQRVVQQDCSHYELALASSRKSNRAKRVLRQSTPSPPSTGYLV